MKRITFIAVLLCLTLLSVSGATACPMCKAALAAQEGSGNLVQGFMWSIIFMLSMPFTILGTFCGCMYLAVRRAKATQAAQLAAADGSEPQAADELLNA